MVSTDRHALDELGVDLVKELLSDTRLLLSSASEAVPLLLMFGRRDEGTDVLERAIEAAADTGDYDLVMRLEAQGLMWNHLPPASVAERIERYPDVIQPDSPAHRVMLSLEAVLGAFSGKAAAEVAEAARRAVENGAVFREHLDGVVSSIPIYALLRADALDAAERAIELYTAEAHAHGGGFSSGASYLNAELAFVRGDVARAEPDVRAAVEGGRLGGALGVFPNWVGLLVEVLVERDELGAAERELLDSGLAGDLPDDWWLIPLLFSRARLRLAQGRGEDGLADLFAMAEVAARHGITNQALGPAGATTAIALAAAGQHEAARGVADIYEAAARAWGTARAIGTALHCKGIVDGGEKGIALLRESIDTLEDSPARMEHAKALTDLGSLLRRCNRRADAREPLRAAVEIARPRGMVAVARRAHDELGATGENLGRFVAVGIESLTPSERRIAELAASGLTNRQIAQQLFLSVKTVESHLRGAYRKLDIKSRGQLPNALE